LDNLSGYFPKLEGFREVGKLNIGYLGLNGGSIEIGNIRKINGDFSYWANSNVKAVEFPALEEVTGNFELYSNIKEYHFPITVVFSNPVPLNRNSSISIPWISRRSIPFDTTNM